MSYRQNQAECRECIEQTEMMGGGTYRHHNQWREQNQSEIKGGIDDPKRP
jgi:hypothetical protein